MTNKEIVDELTTLKKQFAIEIDKIIQKITNAELDKIFGVSSDDSEQENKSKTTSIMDGLMLKKRQPVVWTPEEKGLHDWFDRPRATDDEPKYHKQFWGKFPTVEDAFERSSNDDNQFTSQLNKAFYAIAYQIVKRGYSNGKSKEDIIEQAIVEANVLIYCASIQSVRYVDSAIELRFIKNVKRIATMIESGKMH